jgi:hypothetical protein
MILGPRAALTYASAVITSRWVLREKDVTMIRYHLKIPNQISSAAMLPKRRAFCSPDFAQWLKLTPLTTSIGLCP